MMEDEPWAAAAAAAEEVLTNFSIRDAKKLTSQVRHLEEDLINEKRRWLLGASTCGKKYTRPKFSTTLSLTESFLRSDEVSYDILKSSVEKSFGEFGKCQRKHHVVQDYVQFFESFTLDSYPQNPSYFLSNLYSMMNALSNSALWLIADLVTEKKVSFKKTRSHMIRIIKTYLPEVLGKLSYNGCPAPVKQLSQIFRYPSNFREEQLSILTLVTPSLLSSINKALQELDEMPSRDLHAMNRKLREMVVVPQFPPSRLGGTRELLLECVKKKCQQVLSNLAEGVDLPKPFAKALSIVHLSRKQKTRCVDITTSEFYPFSPEVVGLQNEILGALWSLPKVRIKELKSLQPLVDPEASVTTKAFRNALRKYLMDYLFDCDVVEIPDKVSRVLASLNRRSRRRPWSFSAEMIEEDLEATLNISSRVKQLVCRADENSEASASDSDMENSDSDFSEISYFSHPSGYHQGFCLNDKTEGIGDSGVAFCSTTATNSEDYIHFTNSDVINNSTKQNHILKQDESTPSSSSQFGVGLVDDDCPQKDQYDRTILSQHYLGQGSIADDCCEKSNLNDDNLNPTASGDFFRKPNLHPNVDKTSSRCHSGKNFMTADMRETAIQEICDETSFLAYRLIGRVLDKCLQIDVRETNEMTRYYLRGGSSLESSGIRGSEITSTEDIKTDILIRSVEELLPNTSKSCMEKVKKLMKQPCP